MLIDQEKVSFELFDSDPPPPLLTLALQEKTVQISGLATAPCLNAFEFELFEVLFLVCRLWKLSNALNLFNWIFCFG